MARCDGCRWRAGFKGDLSKIWRIEGGGDDVRVATSSGLLRVGADGVARPVSPELTGLRSMSSARDARGRLWVGTQDGAWLDGGAGHGHMFSGHPLLPGGFPADWIWQITRDREGGLWFAVADAGRGLRGAELGRLHPHDPCAGRPGQPGDHRGRGGAGQPRQPAVGGRGRRHRQARSGHRHGSSTSCGDMPESVISMAEDPQGRLWAVGAGRAVRGRRMARSQPLDTGAVGLSRPNRLVCGQRRARSTWRRGARAFSRSIRRPAQVRPVPMPDSAPGARGVGAAPRISGEPWYASAAGLMRMGPRAAQRMVFVDGVPRRFVMAVAFDSSGFWVAWENGLEHFRYRRRPRRARSAWCRCRPTGRAATSSACAPIARTSCGCSPTRGCGGSTRSTDRVHPLRPAGWPAQRRVQQRPHGDAGQRHDLRRDQGRRGRVQSGAAGRAAAAELAPKVVISAISVRERGVMRTLPAERHTLQLGWRDRDLRVVARVSSFINPAANRFRFRLAGLRYRLGRCGPAWRARVRRPGGRRLHACRSWPPGLAVAGGIWTRR